VSPFPATVDEQHAPFQNDPPLMSVAWAIISRSAWFVPPITHPLLVEQSLGLVTLRGLAGPGGCVLLGLAPPGRCGVLLSNSRRFAEIRLRICGSIGSRWPSSCGNALITYPNRFLIRSSCGVSDRFAKRPTEPRLYVEVNSSYPYIYPRVEGKFRELRPNGALSSSGASLVMFSTLCYSTHTLPRARGMIHLLHGQPTPREGTGRLPVLLLETWASYPNTYLPTGRNASHRSCGGARKGDTLSR
jgi:hypothetical protein